MIIDGSLASSVPGQAGQVREGVEVYEEAGEVGIGGKGTILDQGARCTCHGCHLLQAATDSFDH